MCMKLERHKDSIFFFWKDTNIPKDIEKNEKICFCFNILGSIRAFWNITIYKMFI
jgi:general stress protein 26